MLINRWKPLLSYIPLCLLMACAHTAPEVLGNEGIEDNSNHPRTIEALREESRATRDLAEANEMFDEIIELELKTSNGLEDPKADDDFLQYPKHLMESAEEAWEKYLGAQTHVEATLMKGSVSHVGGFPGQEDESLSIIRLRRERIDHILQLLKIMDSGEQSEVVQSKIKSALERIERLQSQWRLRMRNLNETWHMPAEFGIR